MNYYNYKYHQGQPQKKRKKTIRRLLFTIIFLCIIAIILFISSSIFAIKHIEIIGNKNIYDSSVLNVVDGFYDSNLLRVKEKSVKKLVKETVPVKDVSIKRQLPNTLIINIEERKIVAALNYSNSFALIDDSGIVVDVKSSLENFSIPIITGIMVSDVKIAKKPKLDIDSDFYNELLKLIRLTKPHLSELSEIHLDIEKNITKFCLYTLDGYKINISDINDKKIYIGREILEDLRENYRGKGIIDITTDTAIFKPFTEILQDNGEEGQP